MNIAYLCKDARKWQFMEIGSMKKDKQYCDIDHANTQLDRLRVHRNRAANRRVSQRRAADSINPPGAMDPTAKPSGKDD